MQSLRLLAVVLASSVSLFIGAAGALADESDQGWQTYHSDAGGFSVSVPPGWLVDERSSADGSVITTLSSPDSQAGIAILADADSVAADPSDLPNMRCEPTTVGGLPTERCTDTIALSTTLRVVAGNGVYEIAAHRQRLDSDPLQNVLASLTFDQMPAESQAPAPPAQVPPPAGLPGVGCGGMGAGLGKVRPLCPAP